MSKEVIETIHGKHNVYEVIKDGSVIGPTKYYVRSSDSNVSGTFSSLADAVRWAREKAEKR